LNGAWPNVNPSPFRPPAVGLPVGFTALTLLATLPLLTLLTALALLTTLALLALLTALTLLTTLALLACLPC
jgi:hypothetical protein